MNRMMAAYWHKDSLEIYSYRDNKPVKFASGSLESLQSIKKGLGIKILIVGRDHLIHLRKRYPPAPKEKLTKAVKMELGELFPFSTPAFYCRIFRSVSNYVEVDIWGWESVLYEKLKTIFPFSHVIPEDVLFVSDEPEVRVFQNNDGVIHMLACAKNRFLDSASIPGAGFDNAQLGRFLFNLGQIGEEIHRIRIYGLTKFLIGEIPGVALLRTEETIYPSCLEDMAQVALGEFKVRGEYRFLPRQGLVMRIGLYVVVGYGLMLLLTMRNYDQTAEEIRRLMSAIENNANQKTAQLGTDYADVVQEVNTKLQKGQAPLKMMNMLAQKLPDGSFINRLILTEDYLEIYLSSKDPLMVIKSLGSSKTIKKLMVKGAPSKDRATGLYNMAVTLSF